MAYKFIRTLALMFLGLMAAGGWIVLVLSLLFGTNVLSLLLGVASLLSMVITLHGEMSDEFDTQEPV